MSISKRVLKDGTTRWVVCEYTGFTIDGRRDRRKVTCRSLKEARTVQAGMISERDRMRNRSGRITFGDYVRDWYLPSKRGLARSSLDTYERELRLRLLPAFGAMDIGDVRRPHIQRMVDGCGTWKVARKALDVLRQVMNEAIGDGLLQTNPATASYSMPPRSHPAPAGDVIGTYDGMHGILAAVREWQDEACEIEAVTGLLLGLRPGERLALDWGDIDFKGHVVHVRHSYTACKGGAEYKGTKTQHSVRDVPLDGYAWERLHAIGCGDVVRIGPLMTGRRSGTRLTPSSAQNRWRSFMRAHPGFPPVTLESMRHSFATSYLAAGGKVENLSRIMGHADIMTTYRRYVHPDMGQVADDMREAERGIS